jgi:transposase, IS5 family
MLKERQNIPQMTFLNTFEEQLTHKHPLYILANQINWEKFEKEFTKHYNDKMGRPAKSIRLMVGLLILKHIRNLSDESVVEQFQENSYYQYFCGEESFITKQPCDASELVHFRNRIGKEGMELIFKESVRINGKDGKEKQVVVDTTVQEKNITFPTDDKLHKKIISKCVTISEKEGIELRQSYKRTIKKLSYQQRFRKSQKQQKIARKAGRKIKTIAGRLVRELERKLPADKLSEYSSTIDLFKKVLAQKRNDKNKVYSIHEPSVECISKGKTHKKYEFGNKVSIMLTKNTGVIVGALSLEKNDYDGHTLEPALKQYKEFYNKEPQKAIVDLGYKGIKQIGQTEIVSPQKKGKTLSEKRSLRKDHRRRSSIEANISHMKNNHRLDRNYYRHVIGDTINLLLSASAYNFKRMMRKWAEKMKYFLSFLISLLRQIFPPYLQLKTDIKTF